MPDTLFWDNSEVQHVRVEGCADTACKICVLFSAAAVRLSAQPDEATAVAGFVKQLEWVGVNATLTGSSLVDCVGAVADGELAPKAAPAQRLRQLSLPWQASEPFVLTLRFRNGSALRIEAASGHCTPQADSRFIESYAC